MSARLYVQPGFQVPGRARCYSGTPFAIKVARLLRYKGVPFETIEVGWLERASRIQELGTSRKLPVLELEGRHIEDSTQIAYALERSVPTPPILPEDPLLRARCHFLEEWSDEVLYWYGIYDQDMEVALAAYFAALPENLRKEWVERFSEQIRTNLLRQGVGRYPRAKVVDDIERGLDHLVAYLNVEPFLAGPAPSLADFAVFGQIARRLAGTNPWFESAIELRPALRDWYQRVDDLSE